MNDSMDSAFPRELSPPAARPDGSQENAWIRASQRGDAAAFNQLVLRWERSIYNLSLRMLQDRDEAAEASQEVFLAAFRSIRRFRLESRFSTWLYRIAVNRCISRLRQRPSGLHYSLDDSTQGKAVADHLAAPGSHERDLLRDETAARVRRALEGLSSEQRVVVELKFYRDLTFEEIAAVTRTPLSTVKSRLYSGLEFLKIRLGRTSRSEGRR